MDLDFLIRYKQRNSYFKAISKVIITMNPPINPRTVKSVNLSRSVSGITSSTATKIIVAVAKAYSELV